MIRSAKREGVKHSEFERLKKAFEHEVYSDFEVLNRERRRGKESHDFKDYKEFERLKDADLAKRFTFSSTDQIEAFISNYREIRSWDKISIYSQSDCFHTIIKSNLSIDIETGFEVFLGLAKLSDSMSQIPFLFKTIELITATPGLVERFWKAIGERGLHESWRLDLLTSLKPIVIEEKHLQRLYTMAETLNNDYYLNLERCRHFEKIDSEVIVKLLEIVTRRNEEGNLKTRLNYDFFNGEIITEANLQLFKKAYLQQSSIHDLFDYQGRGLLTILSFDVKFVLDFLKMLFDGNKRERARDHKELSIIWGLPNAEDILDKAIEFMAEMRYNWRFSKHFANAFFQRLTSSEKADAYLINLIAKHSDKPKIMNIAFDVINHSRKGLFVQAFKTYIKINQDLESFKDIEWSQGQVLFSGGTIVGDVRAGEWSRLLGMVEGVKLGSKTRSIRGYIKRRRDSELRFAEDERKRQFFGF